MQIMQIMLLALNRVLEYHRGEAASPEAAAAAVVA